MTIFFFFILCSFSVEGCKTGIKIQKNIIFFGLASHLASALDINIEHVFDDKTKPPEDFPGDYDITTPPANPNCVTGNGVCMFDYESTVDVILQNANTILKDVFNK